MKVEQSVGNTRLFIEGDSVEDVFRQIAKASEIFGAADKCGACGKGNVRFVVRDVADGKKSYEFFELWCLDCRARLSFGKLSDGSGLFPKRKNEDGSWKDNGGWEVYKPTKQ